MSRSFYPQLICQNFIVNCKIQCISRFKEKTPIKIKDFKMVNCSKSTIVCSLQCTLKK